MVGYIKRKKTTPNPIFMKMNVFDAEGDCCKDSNHGLLSVVALTHEEKPRDNIDVFLNKLEAMAAAYMAGKTDSRVSKFLLYSFSLLSAFTGNSYLVKMYRLFEEGYIDLTELDNFGPSFWEAICKKCEGAWIVVKNNPGFRALTNLIAAGVFNFLLPESSYEALTSFLTCKREWIESRFYGTTDFVDCIFRAAVFITSSFRKVIHGEWKKIFVYESELEMIIDTTTNLACAWPLIKTGNETEDYNERTFPVALEKCLDQILAARSRVKTGTTASNTLIQKHVIIEKIRAEMVVDAQHGRLREAPYAFTVIGSSSVGKSIICKMLLDYILKVNGEEHTDEYIRTLNAKDKHAPNMKSYITGIQLDDVSNTVEQFTETSPCDFILNLVNNVPMYFIMADVESKGKVSANPRVVSVSSNITNIGATTYSKEPPSIIRRVSPMIKATVKQDWRIPGTTMLNTEKVTALGRVDPDAWWFDVYMCETDPSSEKKFKTEFGKEVVHAADRWRMKKVKSNLTRDTLFDYLREMSAAHFRSQANVLDTQERLKQLEICPVCMRYNNCACVVPEGAVYVPPRQRGILSREEYQAQVYKPAEVISPETPLQAENITSLISDISENVSATKMKTSYARERSKLGSKALHRQSKDELVAEMTDIYARWNHSSALLREKVMSMYEGTVAQMLCELITILDRMIQRFERRYRLLGPCVLIPSWAEGTSCGATAHARSNPMIRFIEILDGFWKKFWIGSSIVATCAITPYAGMALANATVVMPGDVLLEYIRAYEPMASTRQDFTSGEEKGFILRNLSLFGVSLHTYSKLKRNVCIAIGSYALEHFRNSVALEAGISISPWTMGFGYAGLAILYYNAYTSFTPSYEIAEVVSRIAKKIKQNHPFVGVIDHWIPGGLLAWRIKAIATAHQAEAFTVDTPEDIVAVDSSHVDKFDPRQSLLDPCPVPSKETPEELSNKISKNIVFGGREAASCGVFVCTNFMLIPRHVTIANKPGIHEFVRKENPNGLCGNAKIKTFVTENDRVQIRDIDMDLLYVPNSGDFRNIVGCFPKNGDMKVAANVATTGKICIRTREGFLEKIDYRDAFRGAVANNRDATFKNVLSKADNGLGNFGTPMDGLYYNADTQPGYCCGPLVSDGKASCIQALHIAGNKTNRKATAGGVIVTQEDIISAMEKLAERTHVTVPAQVSDKWPKVEEVVHHMSPLNAEGSSVRNFGTYQKTAKAASMVMATKLGVIVQRTFSLPFTWSKPKLRGPDGKQPHHPYHEWRRKIDKGSKGFPSDLIDLAARDYFTPLVYEARKKHWVAEGLPLTEFEIINGRDGCKYIEAMHMQTSVGFPTYGPKTNKATLIEGNRPYYIVDQCYWDEMYAMEAYYAAGLRNYPPFTAALKDEPTKTNKDKVRVFQIIPMAFSMLLRKYFLPPARFICLMKKLSECMVGIDPEHPEWHEFIQHLCSRGGNAMWTDFEFFDGSVACQLTKVGLLGIISIAEAMGFPEHDLRIMLGAVEDIAAGVVLVNGDMIQLLGAILSGFNLTAILNSIVNSLVTRAAFFKYYPHLDFRSAVHQGNFGDDNIGEVSPHTPKYNMINLCAFCKAHGMGMTMGDKASKVTEYVDIERADFLKRKIQKHPELGIYLGALQEESIFKSLSAVMKNKYFTVDQITGMNVDGALDRFFFYGEAEFERYRGILLEMVTETDLLRFCNGFEKSFAIRLEEYNEKHKSALERCQQFELPKQRRFWESLTRWEKPKPFDGQAYHEGVTTVKIGLIRTIMSEPERISVDLKNNTGGTPVKGYSDFCASVYRRGLPLYEENILDEMEMAPLEAESTFGVTTTEFTAPESGEQKGDSPAMDDLRHRILTPVDTLGDFFARPIKIYERTWSTGSTLNGEFHPLALIISNARNSNRMNNYNLSSFTVKLRIIVNGNSFFYGRGMFSYHPYSGLDDLTPIGTGSLTQYSQMPTVYVDPTLSSGGDLTIPFVYPSDYAEVVQDNGTFLGTVVVREIVPLKHVTGGTGNVTISVYGWLEDVILHSPTAANMGVLSAQSEYEQDTKPVSGPASAIAAGARALSNLPYIGPYAKATDIGASLVAGIAQAFGLSKPVIARESDIMVPRAAGNTAVTNVADTSLKLSVDVKQELTVDPRVGGMNRGDEMSLAWIGNQESYITTFTWGKGYPAGDLLYNWAVDPAITITDGSGGVDIPACAGVALAHRYWNGCMTYRIEIVASAFHRGTIAVVYDPYITPADYESNVVFQQVIDLASCRNFEIKVGNHQNRTLLSHKPYGSTLFMSDTRLPTTLDESNGLHGNGFISVWIVNELTSSNTEAAVNDDINVNVYARCDEMEVFVPSEDYARIRFQALQSAVLAEAPLQAEAVEESISEESDLLTEWYEPWFDESDYDYYFQKMVVEDLVDFRPDELVDYIRTVLQVPLHVFSDDGELIYWEDYLRSLDVSELLTGLIDYASFDYIKTYGVADRLAARKNLLHQVLLEDIEQFEPLTLTYNRMRREVLEYGALEAQSEVADPVVEDPESYEQCDTRNNAHPEINLVYTGEALRSVRSLVKRYVPYLSFGFPDSSSADNLRLEHSYQPVYAGTAPGGIHTGSTNVVNTGPLQYFRAAFCQMRGGMRWKVANQAGAAAYREITGVVMRAKEPNYSVQLTTRDFTNQDTIATAGRYSSGVAAGCVLMNNAVNAVLEFETPFYTNYRFIPGRRGNWTESDPYFPEGFRVTIIQAPGLRRAFDLWYSTAEDFSLSFFIGWPKGVAP